MRCSLNARAWAQVRFELSTLDSEPGLVAYMNIFARSNRVVNSLMLRKVSADSA